MNPPRALATRIGLAIVLTVLVATCGGPSSATATPTPPTPAPGITVTPTPTPSPTPTPLEILQRAAAAMRAETDVHFALEYEGRVGTPLLEGIELLSAVGDVSGPDLQLLIGVRMPALGVFVEQGAVRKDGQMYLSDPLTGRWSAVTPEQVPCSFEGLIRRVADMAEQGSNVSLVGEERLSGRATLHLKAILPSDGFAALFCTLPSGEGIDANVWVDIETHLILRVDLDGRISADEPDPLQRTLVLSDYGVRVPVEAPEILPAP